MQNPPLHPPPGGSGAPPAIAQYQAPVAYAGQKSYAGFWIRLAARLVDGLIVGIPLSVIFFILLALAGGLASSTSNSSQNTQSATGVVLSGVFILFYLLVLVATIGYQVYFWGTSGSTLGMRLFKLQVVDAITGGPIGIPRAVVRWLMTIVNSWACYIGWIWVAFDPRKQGWHDKVANSVVLQG
jgi:uncharacterized RDD family membrane protein YckC